MRRRIEGDDRFARRKAADFERWRRNEEPDPRERDLRDDDLHSRFRNPRRDARTPVASDDADSGNESDEDEDSG
jgi:hypothetical protein